MKSRILVSPHMDDAAFCLGGYLAKTRGIKTHVLTVFNSVWTCCPEYTGLDINQINKSEHEAIMRSLGCSTEYWEYPEGMERGYPSWESPLDLDKDKILYDDLCEQFLDLLSRSENTEFFFPIAIESHPDHDIIQRVLFDCLNREMNTINSFFLYEDLPYAFYADVGEWMNGLLKHYSICPITVDIFDVIERKACMLRQYKSQVEERDVAASIEYARIIGTNGMPVERFWKIIEIKK